MAKKGQPSWNKGKKWSNEAKEKMRVSAKKCTNHPGRFKKGHKIPKEIFKKLKKFRFKKGMTPWNKGKKYFAVTGSKNHNWNGGKTKLKIGYVLIAIKNHPFRDPRGYVYEHRLIIEKQIGRYLKSEESVHHLGKKDDNRPHQLMAFASESAHQRFHHNPNNVKPEEIIFNGRLL